MTLLNKILVALLRVTHPLRSRFSPVWSGVYRTFAEVPVRGPGFDGELWVRGTREYTEAAIRDMREGPPERLGSLGDHALLPVLAASAAVDGHLSVLDFGGGMGIGYVHLRATLPELSLRYVVVENERICEVGRQLYGPTDEIEFVAAPPGAEEPVDILYIRSALQYVEDYRGLLRKLLGARPRWALFATLSAGDNPTFATAQRNVPGSVIAYWFHDVREIVALMDVEGYELRMRSPSSDRLYGLQVPSSHHIERGCDLLFARREGS